MDRIFSVIRFDITFKNNFNITTFADKKKKKNKWFTNFLIFYHFIRNEQVKNYIIKDNISKYVCTNTE